MERFCFRGRGVGEGEGREIGKEFHVYRQFVGFSCMTTSFFLHACMYIYTCTHDMYIHACTTYACIPTYWMKNALYFWHTHKHTQRHTEVLFDLLLNCRVLHYYYHNRMASHTASTATLQLLIQENLVNPSMVKILSVHGRLSKLSFTCTKDNCRFCLGPSLSF